MNTVSIKKPTKKKKKNLKKNFIKKSIYSTENLPLSSHILPVKLKFTKRVRQWLSRTENGL